jgi:hypothetical protein
MSIFAALLTASVLVRENASCDHAESIQVPVPPVIHREIRYNKAYMQPCLGLAETPVKSASIPESQDLSHNHGPQPVRRLQISTT